MSIDDRYTSVRRKSHDIKPRAEELWSDTRADGVINGCEANAPAPGQVESRERKNEE